MQGCKARDVTWVAKSLRATYPNIFFWNRTAPLNPETKFGFGFGLGKAIVCQDKGCIFVVITALFLL
jgi:hypothetical protein